jgi:hypothetical protein
MVGYPATDVVAVPSHPGTQVGPVVVLIVMLGAFGAVNCMVVVALHPLASVTVMVYIVTAHKLPALPKSIYCGTTADRIVYPGVPPTVLVVAVPSQTRYACNWCVVLLIEMTGEFGDPN